MKGRRARRAAPPPFPPPPPRSPLDDSLGMLKTLHDLCADAERDLDPDNPERPETRLPRAYARVRTAHTIIDHVRALFDEYIRTEAQAAVPS